MFKISCFKEKCYLMAYHFCENEKISLRPERVFGIWNTWWKDFAVQGHPIYKIRNGQLVHNKKDTNKDDGLLAECNQVFQKAYDFISDYVKKHSRAEVREAINKQRTRQLRTLKYIARKKGQTVVMIKNKVGSGRLAVYLLVGKDFKQTGDYDTLLHYIKNSKGREDNDKSR